MKIRGKYRLAIDLSFCFSERTFNYEGDLLIERSRLSLVTGCVMAILLGVFVYPAPTLAFEIQMDVAANVLNVQSEGIAIPRFLCFYASSVWVE